MTTTLAAAIAARTRCVSGIQIAQAADVRFWTREWLTPMTREHIRYIICPRECSSPKTEHCFGKLENDRAKCLYCGRWMPLEDALDFSGETD